MDIPYVQRKCLNCGKIFNICGSCFCGQKSCSIECQKTRARKQSRERSLRYSKTVQGKASNKARQARFRGRKAMKTPSVTHATSQEAPNNLNPKQECTTELRCAFCGREVHINMQDSPHPATEWRRRRRKKKRGKCDIPRKQGQNRHHGARWAQDWNHCPQLRAPPRYCKKGIGKNSPKVSTRANYDH